MQLYAGTVWKHEYQKTPLTILVVIPSARVNKSRYAVLLFPRLNIFIDQIKCSLEVQQGAEGSA